jgi:transporter family protein
MVPFGDSIGVFCGSCVNFRENRLRKVDLTVGAAARAVVMMIFLIIFVIFDRKTSQLLRFTNKEMGFILLSGVAGALSWLFYFAALKLADATKVVSVDRTSVLIVLALSALFLGEKITLKTAIAVFLIFTGLLLLV